MANLKLRYVKWRDGRPRAVHGPRERAIGFKDADLRHGPDGAWYSFEEAQAWSVECVKAIAEQRQAPRPRRQPAPGGRTVGELLKAWLKSDDVQALAPNTVTGYGHQVEAILYKPQTAEQRAAGVEPAREKFSLAPVETIGKPEVKGFFEYQRRGRGWHMALASVAVIRAAWSWGETSTAWRLKYNPAKALKLPRPDGRIVIYTDGELRHLVATADAFPCGAGMTRASVGDAIMLGLYNGQRQGDRLAMEDAGLVDGRRQFRQSKTGAVVAIPETPALRERLEAARSRVAAIALKRGLDKASRPTTIIVDETTGRPYKKFTYRHVFADVRTAAAATMPSLADKREGDLRDTCVTWLARAGATIPEIASITGHSPQSIYAILKHYLAITPELADAAIAKLVAWMTKEEMAV